MNKLAHHLPIDVETWQQHASPRTELHHGFEYDLRAQATTARHALLCTRIAVLLHNEINRRSNNNCIVRTEGPLVRLNDTEAYIPDVSVECSRFVDLDPMHVEPEIVIEVLSPTTAAYDIGTKRNNYMKLDYMRNVVLVDDVNKTICVDYIREADGLWSQTLYRTLHPNHLYMVQLHGGLMIDPEEVFKI